MKKILTLDFWNGKKTYVIGVILFVLGGLKAVGVLDSQTYDLIFKVLVGLGLITLRKGIKND